VAIINFGGVLIVFIWARNLRKSDSWI